MTIIESIRQGFHYARTCRSLWLFGFFVGIASGGSSGSGGGEGSGGGAAGLGAGLGSLLSSFFNFSLTTIALILGGIILAAVVAFVMRFISEGALIEGVARARQGVTLTMGEGFRAGWAHWGVLLRIALLYFGATIVSLALVAAPCVMAFRALGLLGGLALSIPALVIAVPWLLTLHLVQAFASRIAVLENRRAIDAIGKARLFLHGRLMHGLKLIVATFVGSLAMVFAGILAIVIVGLVAITPVALVLTALMPTVRFFAVIVLGFALLVPAMCVLTAMVGTLRSSIWTIGYVTQVES